MTKSFHNQIPGQHKPVFQSPLEIEETELRMDWAFRTIKGPAAKTETQVVLEMRTIAKNPDMWGALGLPSRNREAALTACNEWLEKIGDNRVVRLERE